MGSSMGRKEIIKICLLCTVWYGSSAGSNIATKQFLFYLPYPLTVSMIHMIVLMLLLIPFSSYLNVPPTPDVTRKFYTKRLIPLAIGKLLGAVFTHFSIWKVPISYAHTVKAMMPIFTVLLSIVILKEYHNWKIYASLIPIVGGVLIATVTEISFKFSGLFAALFSTVCFALQNIYSKKSLREVQIHHLRLLLVITQVSIILLFPIWMYHDVWNIITTIHKVQSIGYILILLPLAGVLSFLQNIAAFSMLSAVSPVSYSVASSTKRIVIITISLLLLRNPVTIMNICGMALAVFGVLLYNKIRYDINKDKKSTLPSHVTNNGGISIVPVPAVDQHTKEPNGGILRNNSFISSPLKVI